jgi:hypothetical protein
MVALVPLVPVAGKAALALSKGAITKAATRSLVSGAAFQAGAELVAQIAEWARSIDGNWDSQGQTPGDGVAAENGCWKMESGSAIYEEADSGNPADFRPPTGAQCNVLSCTAAVVDRFPESGLNSVALSRTYADGTSNTTTITRSESWIWRLNPTCGGGVCSSDPYPNPGGEPLAPINTGPIQSGDCTINTTFYGFLANPDGTGNVQPVFVMEPAAELRANGGAIIGECNFSPTVVVGGGGDGNEPPRTYPMPPDEPGGDEWWKAIARGAAAGLAEFVVEQAMEALFGNQAEASFTLVAPCNKDEEGNPSTYTVEFPSQSYSTRMLAWQVASADLLQQHLNWKTPICHEKPQLEGDWVTLRFESDEPSPNSNRVIRKLLRYRSKSGAELGSITDYWRGFTWTTGPVIVTHADAWWGQPKCWAVSADEGKRVLRHAAGEAGLDPDQVGRWIISGSRDPRYGVSLPVKFADLDGGPWVTQRDGPSGPALINR